MTTTIFILILIFVFAAWTACAHRRRLPWRVRNAQKVLRTLRRVENGFTDAQRFAYLRKVDPFVFEEIVLLCFRERGCRTQSSPYTRDGGIDGTIWLPTGEKMLIQSKRYTGHIQRAHVLAFEQLLQRRSSMGCFVHTGRTGKASWRVARNSPLEIVSGPRLLQLILGEPMSFQTKKLPGLSH